MTARPISWLSPQDTTLRIGLNDLISESTDRNTGASSQLRGQRQSADSRHQQGSRRRRIVASRRLRIENNLGTDAFEEFLAESIPWRARIPARVDPRAKAGRAVSSRYQFGRTSSRDRWTAQTNLSDREAKKGAFRLNVGWSSSARTPRRGIGAAKPESGKHRCVLETPLQGDSLKSVEAQIHRIGVRGASDATSTKLMAAGLQIHPRRGEARTRSGGHEAHFARGCSDSRDFIEARLTGQDQITFFGKPDTIDAKPAKLVPAACAVAEISDFFTSVSCPASFEVPSSRLSSGWSPPAPPPRSGRLQGLYEITQRQIHFGRCV